MKKEQLHLELEPKNIRLNNDLIGAILWGPPERPTLSIGKADIWDRRYLWDEKKEPELTVAQIVKQAMQAPNVIPCQAQLPFGIYPKKLTSEPEMWPHIRQPADSAVRRVVSNRQLKMLGEFGYYTANYYPFPCPKPGGQVIFILPFMAKKGHLECYFEPVSRKDQWLGIDGSRPVCLSAKAGRKSLFLKIYVHAVQDLIVVEGKAQNIEAGDAAIRVYRHQDTVTPKTKGAYEQLPPPAVFHDGECAGIIQSFSPDLTFPAGFDVVVAGRIVGIKNKIKLHEGKTGLGTPMIAKQEGRVDHGTEKNYFPINNARGAAATFNLAACSGRFLALFTVVTSQDGKPRDEAKRLLSEAAMQDISFLCREHERQFAGYRDKSIAHVKVAKSENSVPRRDNDINTDIRDDAAQNYDVEIRQRWGGIPWKRHNQGYYGDVPICSVGSTKFAFQDRALWHGDFHFDEIRAEELLALGQFDKVERFVELMELILPMAQTNAARVFGCRGAALPVATFPLKSERVTHTNLTWELIVEMTAMNYKVAWLYFRYTWDMDFLKNRAYPLMREGARFYADFLKREKDGLYHIVPCMSIEHWGIWPKLSRNKDSLSALTLIKYLLRACASAACLLGEDSKEARKWKEIAEHLTPYPVYQGYDVALYEGSIFVDVAGAPPLPLYNTPCPLAAVFWGDDISLDGPADLLATALRTYKYLRIWQPHSGYLNRCIRPRLGIYEAGAPIGPENLLLSYMNAIHVFPAVPQDRCIEFENLRAEGAFAVNARMKNGRITDLQIRSLAGNPCRVVNPWEGKPVLVTNLEKRRPVPLKKEGCYITFHTHREACYQLTPSFGRK